MRRLIYSLVMVGLAFACVGCSCECDPVELCSGLDEVVGNCHKKGWGVYEADQDEGESNEWHGVELGPGDEIVIKNFQLSGKCVVPEEWKDGIGHDFLHYKGKMYRLLGLAPHSETLEPMAVYQLLYGGNWRHLLRFRRVSHLRHHPESARTKLEACS